MVRFRIRCSRRRKIRLMGLPTRYCQKGFIIYAGRGYKGRGTMHVVDV